VIVSRIVNDEIEHWRRIIDQIDLELTKLLNRRTECAVEIGKIKAREGLGVYDPERETEVMENVQKSSGKHLDSATIRHIFERIIDETRRSERQHRAKIIATVENDPNRPAD
jgi:chorismate mutase